MALVFTLRFLILIEAKTHFNSPTQIEHKMREKFLHMKTENRNGALGMCSVNEVICTIDNDTNRATLDVVLEIPITPEMPIKSASVHAKTIVQLYRANENSMKVSFRNWAEGLDLRILKFSFVEPPAAPTPPASPEPAASPETPASPEESANGGHSAWTPDSMQDDSNDSLQQHLMYDFSLENREQYRKQSPPYEEDKASDDGRNSAGAPDSIAKNVRRMVVPDANGWVYV